MNSSLRASVSVMNPLAKRERAQHLASRRMAHHHQRKHTDADVHATEEARCQDIGEAPAEALFSHDERAMKRLRQVGVGTILGVDHLLLGSLLRFRAALSSPSSAPVRREGSITRAMIRNSIGPTIRFGVR